MKKLLLFAAIIYSSTLFAQTPATGTTNPIGPVKVTAGDGMLPANDIVKNIGLTKNLSLFYTFIQTTNLAETYKSKGPITVFVPVDSAFNNLPVGKLDSLKKPTHVWELTDIISYHAIAGSLKAKDIEKEINSHKGIATFTTLSGGTITAKIDSNRNIVLIDGNGGQSMISRFDIEQNNGIIHIVSRVLMPKPRII